MAKKRRTFINPHAAAFVEGTLNKEARRKFEKAYTDTQLEGPKLGCELAAIMFIAGWQERHLSLKKTPGNKK